MSSKFNIIYVSESFFNNGKLQPITRFTEEICSTDVKLAAVRDGAWIRCIARIWCTVASHSRQHTRCSWRLRMYMEIMTSSFNLRAECNSLFSLKVLLYQYLKRSSSQEYSSCLQYLWWLVKLSMHKSDHQRYFLRLMNKKFWSLVFWGTRLIPFFF